MKRFLLLAALLAGPGLTRAQSWQWVAAATGPGNARILTTATDGTGGTIVAGDFTGTITLGSTTLTSAGNRDVFVARLNSAGAFTQAVRAGARPRTTLLTWPWPPMAPPPCWAAFTAPPPSLVPPC
ncbi:hypothetical protein [Hymenobacter cellulosilyticus]|uniref:Uncharacterized protein n=1 Tax=Hymenobacter cellulosilyticus TaxID=2932248 RepID=A0A8T9Q8L5_9BACT|nr:hypothetical protein [Hymenobacter cellulosilyticus]UOQ71869.1 hypothetical protein MUN79_25250 [Hymenobacter cellulosilyticus]